MASLSKEILTTKVRGCLTSIASYIARRLTLSRCHRYQRKAVPQRLQRRGHLHRRGTLSSVYQYISLFWVLLFRN